MRTNELCCAQTDAGSMVWLDYDNDGWADVLCGGGWNGGYGNRLFHNNRNSTFTQLPEASFSGAGVHGIWTTVGPDQTLTGIKSQGYTNTPSQFSGITNSVGGLQLSFIQPAAGARYLLEGSTDLVDWSKLMVHTSAGGASQLTDTRATNRRNIETFKPLFGPSAPVSPGGPRRGLRGLGVVLSPHFFQVCG